MYTESPVTNYMKKEALIKINQVYMYCYGNSNGFEVKVGMHQGSALSPLLFVMVMEAREFRVSCLTMGVVVCR